MNRRSFLNTILKASVAPMFLPGGGRIWKATFSPKVNPEWVNADFEVGYIMSPDFFFQVNRCWKLEEISFHPA